MAHSKKAANKQSRLVKKKNNKNLSVELKTWDAKFKKAIQAGNKPETDLFEGLQ